MPRSICLLLLCLFAAPKFAPAEQPAEPGQAVEKTTYVDHVLPIFRARCGSCHNASDRKGGLALDNYAAAMEGGASGEVVEPGDLDSSYLWSLIVHESEPAMPPNADKLPEKELELIRRWIEGGALENSGSKAVIKEKASLARIDVSGERPADVAYPADYYGEPVHRLASANSVTALAVSPWAPLAAVSGYQQVALYNLETREPCGAIPFPEGQPRVIAFSRSGDLLLVAGGQGGAHGRVVVYDVRSGERKIEAGEEYDEVLAADLSSDQSQIALGGPKKLLRVYSTETGDLRFERDKHTDWITAVEFSPDGVLLASGDRSNGLIVWEAYSGEIFYDLTGHKGAVTGLSWRQDSNVLASASEDGTVKLWDMQNGSQLKSWDAHAGGVTSLRYTRDGRLVTTGRDLVTRVWAGDGKKLNDLSKLADLPLSVAFDNESQAVLAGDWTGKVVVWNVDSGKPVWELSTNPPDLAAQLTAAEAELDGLRKQLASQNSAREALRKTIADRQSGILPPQQKLAAAAARRDEVVAAQKQAQAAEQAEQAALAAAEQSVQPALAARGAAQAEIKSLTKKIADLKERISELETARAVAKDRQSASDQAQKQARIASETARDAAQPTPAEQKLIAADERVKQNVDARAALAKAAAKVARNAAQQARDDKDALHKLQAEFEQSKQSLQQTQAALQAAQDRLPELQAAAETAEQTLKPYRESLTASREALAQATAAAEQAQSEVKAAETTLATAQAAAKPTDEENGKLTEAEKRIAAAETEIARLTARIERVKALQARLPVSAAGNE